MNRRSFLTLASGLLVPWERERVYSFATPREPQWRRGSISSFVTWNADRDITPRFPPRTRWQLAQVPIWRGQCGAVIHHVNGEHYAQGIFFA